MRVDECVVEREESCVEREAEWDWRELCCVWRDWRVVCRWVCVVRSDF